MHYLGMLTELVWRAQAAGARMPNLDIIANMLDEPRYRSSQIRFVIVVLSSHFPPQYCCVVVCCV